MVNKIVLNLNFFWCIAVTSAKYLFPEYADIFSHPQNLPKSYFGFTVQLQSSKSGNPRLIVGAPRSNDSTQHNLLEPGAIFSCPLENNSGSTPKCEQYEFDSGNDETFIKGKNNSCLGYSLDVNSDGRLVACAPKWINYYIKGDLPLKMNGMCYYLKDSSNIQPTTENLIPFNNADLQYDRLLYNYIFGETGFSSQLINNGESVIMTGVGFYNWTGSIIQYNPEQENKKFKITRPKNVKELETYSYFGYSLASGNFNTSDSKKIFYVSGSPRSDNLTGMVNIYEQLVDFNTFSNRFSIPGKKFGEYFGASLAVADLNGDGFDDLIVGAPMHSTDDKDEIGRIYPYLNQKSSANLKFKKIDSEFLGERERGRFGTAISSIGDINKDGCIDIAVGAPYYGNGVVYIYLGQTSNNALKLDQIIKASEYFPNMRGFGFSLSRGADIDGNYNNDLAIGSYLSDHAVVIKSRPVIKITQLLRSNIQQVDVNTKKFIINYCLKYETKDIPEQLTIRTNLIAENSQIDFNNKNVNIITYTKNADHCIDIDVKINDVLNVDFKINARYEIFNNTNGFCKECPIDATSDKTFELTIPFATGCDGRDCKPNLKVTGYFITEKPLVIGSTNQVELKAKIKNLGEHAFGVKFQMLFSPTSINLENHEKQCEKEVDRLKCNYNNLKAKEEIEKTFVFNVEYLQITEKYLNITLLVQSNFDDLDTTDNNYNIILPITTDVKYNIISNSEPEQLTQYENVTLTKFIHTYNIESIGQTTLDNFSIFVYIPLEYNEKTIVSTRNIDISGCEIQRNEEINPEITENTEVADGTIINLNCTSPQTKSLKCMKYFCEIKDKKTKAIIEVQFDVDVPMFREEGNSVYLVTSLKTDSEYLNLMSYAKTYLIPVIKAANITMYIIIGVIIGIILFLILGLILYKCKFFKKKTIPVPEEEPFMEKDENQEEEQEKTTTVEINNGGTSFEEQDITKLEEDK